MNTEHLQIIGQRSNTLLPVKKKYFTNNLIMKVLPNSNKIKQQSILTLLPHSPKTLLINRSMKLQMLQLLSFMVNQLIESIRLFYQQKQYSAFDPHIGDTLCQIRAYKVLLLSHENKFNVNDVNVRLIRAYELINQHIADFETLRVEKKGKYDKNLDGSEKLCDFMEARDINFSIPEDLIFLTQAKLVTLFNINDFEGITKGIDYAKFCLKAKISKTLAKRIIHYYQQFITELSCSFIMGLVDELPNLRLLKRKLIELQKTDGDNRQVLPCYEVTRIILKHMLKKQQPIVLFIERKFSTISETLSLLFIPNNHGTGFVLSEHFHSIIESSCLVIKGVTVYPTRDVIETREQFIKRLLSVNLDKIVLANMAKHPQFSASELKIFNDNPYRELLDKKSAVLKTNLALEKAEGEFLEMRALSLQKGCCQENSSLFLIKHIFCDTVSHYINYLDYTQTQQLHFESKNYFISMESIGHSIA